MLSHFVTLFNYEFSSNQKVLFALLQASEIPESAKALFSHLLNAQQIWLDRIEEGISLQKVWEFHSENAWSKILEANHLRISQLLKNLTDKDLNKTINYANSQGEKFRSTIGEILTHLTFHGAYHRGQLVLIIKPYSSSLPVTDFIFHSRQAT